MASYYITFNILSISFDVDSDSSINSYSMCSQNYLLEVVLCNLRMTTSCTCGVVVTDLLLPDLYALCPQIRRPCVHRLAILSLVVTSPFFFELDALCS